MRAGSTATSTTTSTASAAGDGGDLGGAGDGGWFGAWERGLAGAPAFAVAERAALERRAAAGDLVLPDGGAGALWHQVANAGITATAHAAGHTTLYATGRGVTRLTDGRSTWGLAGPAGVGAGGAGGATGATGGRRVRWEAGAATWTEEVDGVRIERRVSVAPGAEPVLRIDVWLRSAPGALAGRWWQERWIPAPSPLVLGGLMSPAVPPPPGYDRTERLAWRALYRTSAVSRALTDAYRAAAARLVPFRPVVRPDLRALEHRPRWAVRPRAGVPPTDGATGGGALPSDAVGEAPAWVDLRLPRLVVAVVEGAGPVELDPTTATVAVALTADAEQHLVLAVALATDDPDTRRLLAAARRAEPEASARAWAGMLQLGGTDRPAVEREAIWHAASLVGEETVDACFGRRFVAQGSAYQFVHGLHGAPRDYCLYAVPLAFIDPAAAREQLEVVLRMTRPSGRMHYAHTGRGRCTSGGIHAAPTDLPLFLLWAVTEYVWTTGDHAFLDAVVPFEPAGAAGASTVRDRLLLAWRYVRDRVGVGEHGMLRVGSGDWADPISAMVPDRHAFHERGESGFNTTLAAFALPRVADLLEPTHPDDAGEVRAFAAERAAAMVDAWTGRWFLRGWDGTGGPVGRDHLFLDGQVWALIGGLGDEAIRRTLVDEIASRCDDPSPIGATILDRPHPNRLGMLAPGWDCNGGVWAAINGLLTWGYARHDPARAWALVEAQSFAAHGRAHPGVWYGIWSGPDAYNAWFGSRPGETFVQPATPMAEFPTMNANAHAGPLLGLVRALGIEAGPAGLAVDPAVGPAGWRLSTPVLEADASGVRRRAAGPPG